MQNGRVLRHCCALLPDIMDWSDRIPADRSSAVFPLDRTKDVAYDVDIPVSIDPLTGLIGCVDALEKWHYMKIISPDE